MTEMANVDEAEWEVETLHPHWRQKLAIQRIVWEGESDHQRIRIFENAEFGKILMLDGAVQTTERDEYVYHEMLAHVPIISHGQVRNVLIIGGGDGGVLREVLRHPIEKAILIDIDGLVVEKCQKYLPELSKGAFDDPRTTLVIGDGAEFVAETKEVFEVVIVDSTDPIGPSTILFGEAFYANSRRVLSSQGILVTQNGCPFVQREELKSSYRHFRKLFRHCGFYLAPVPLYIGGFLAFGFGSKGDRMGPLWDSDLAVQLGESAKYYNADIHNACFALPNDFLKWMSEA